eukprot:6905355-Prymnesium_polylepis.2
MSSCPPCFAPALSWVLSAPTAAQGFTLADIFEDLTPYLARGFDQIPGLRGVPSYDFSEVLPRSFRMLTPGPAPRSLACPSASTGAIWSTTPTLACHVSATARPLPETTLIYKLLIAAEEDRDGDGIKDKPLCAVSLSSAERAT